MPQVINADCLAWMRRQQSETIDCCVTSPPYWGQRQYGSGDGEHGQEESDEEYIATQTAVFRELRRLLKPTGTFWLNIGDTYFARKTANRNNATDGMGGHGVRGGGEFEYQQRTSTILKDRCLAGMPWRLAISLIEDGWILRSDIIWHKTNPMPDPNQGRRPYKVHEHVFLFAKSNRYHYEVEHGDDADAKTDVWRLSVESCPWHKAIFPTKLARRCIARGCPEGGLVYDPYAGSGTTLIAAYHEHCRAIGTELNRKYAQLAQKRIDEIAQPRLW